MYRASRTLKSRAYPGNRGHLSRAAPRKKKLVSCSFERHKCRVLECMSMRRTHATTSIHVRKERPEESLTLSSLTVKTEKTERKQFRLGVSALNHRASERLIPVQNFDVSPSTELSTSVEIGTKTFFLYCSFGTRGPGGLSHSSLY